MNEQHIHVPGGSLDYNKITDHIYIGSNQCCMTGLVEVLKNEGITTDISLEEERLDQPFGVEAYLWLPTPNHTPPTQDQLGFGAGMIRRLVKRGKRVYVHCKHGHGRAVTLVAAYFIQEGKTPQEAEEFIKTKRPTIHLQELQKEALKEFWKTAQILLSTTSQKRFMCSICGMQYLDESIAKRCQAWCSEHHSCNLDIIKYAVN